MARILPGETDLYALTDSRLGLGRNAVEQARLFLDAGIRIIQYREKKMNGRKMLDECREIAKLAKAAKACFIIDDHLDLALLCDADGVHIGQEDIKVEDARKLLGDEKIIGLSTHSPAQAREAVLSGADYIGVGPIFSTKTKEDVVPAVGFEYLQWVANNVNLPFVAIGGIKEGNIRSVAKHGANCCAMVSELVGSENIREKVFHVRREMREGIIERGE